jgi:hypothetical protein
MISCRECDKRNICILLTIYCSNCNERFCSACFEKLHNHDKVNK